MPETAEAQADLSISDLRTMMSDKAPAAAPEAKTETPEPEPAPDAQAEEETPQAESGTAEEETESEQNEAEEPLPPGVQKRIAKEVEKRARIQAEIDRAVSDTKAAEAQLAKLQAERRGSDPVNKPEAQASEKPPTFGEAGHEEENWEQFRTRELAWIEDNAIRKFRQEMAQQAETERVQQRVQSGVEQFGEDFPKMTQAFDAVTTPDMQMAVGGMDGWQHLAAHFYKNPSQLKDLADQWAQNPVETLLTIGRIRDSITATKPKTTTAPPLPPPIKKVGGNANASGQDLQSALESGNMSQFRALASKHGVRQR